ncbi:hypothetical protein HYC85_016263 [Camellia sinensis]|uniref:Uncharacterized protein n=1 Tax=Camellia sinensis TaxID=4442 RepID=A0A7J7H0H9_CAMSI|nr:hypothetical protein HYC85_016263 [Camellia sinensis]
MTPPYSVLYNVMTPPSSVFTNAPIQIRAANKAHGDGPKKTRTRDRAVRAMPAPDANAELQSNLDRRRLITHANAKSKSEKFPPPHQDGALGVPLGASHHIDPAFVPPDIPFSSTSFTYSKEPVQNWSGPLVDPVAVASRGKKYAARESTKSFTSKKDKSSNPRNFIQEKIADLLDPNVFTWPGIAVSAHSVVKKFVLSFT